MKLEDSRRWTCLLFGLAGQSDTTEHSESFEPCTLILVGGMVTIYWLVTWNSEPNDQAAFAMAELIFLTRDGRHQVKGSG